MNHWQEFSCVFANCAGVVLGLVLPLLALWGLVDGVKLAYELLDRRFGGEWKEFQEFQAKKAEAELDALLDEAVKKGWPR